MDSASQERILGYFIEEAKEHLETLEKGILDLSSAVEDPEIVKEMFRAAHSIKGGAAMLGYTGIQRTAHRLEDSFKIFQENSIPVDSRLEQLLLGGYDVLKNLVDKLETNQELSEEESIEVVKHSEPIFTQLQSYLEQLLHTSEALPYSEPSYGYLEDDLGTQIREILLEMLSLFRQQATLQNRKELQHFCDDLKKVNITTEPEWEIVVQTAQRAIANPQHNYSTLAPVVLKDLKQAGDLLELGKAAQIVPSDGLVELASREIPFILVPLEPKTIVITLRQMLTEEQLNQVRQALQYS